MSAGMTPVMSGNILVPGLLLASKQGVHQSTHVTLDATIPNGTYYVSLVQGSHILPTSGTPAASPSEGVLAFLHTPRTVVISGANPGPVEIIFDDTPGGVGFFDGLSVVLSSTQFTITPVGAYMLVDSGMGV